MDTFVATLAQQVVSIITPYVVTGTEEFARKAGDAAAEKAKQILESDGYDCSHVPCTTGGQGLVIEYSTVSIAGLPPQ